MTLKQLPNHFKEKVSITQYTYLLYHSVPPQRWTDLNVKKGGGKKLAESFPMHDKGKNDKIKSSQSENKNGFQKKPHMVHTYYEQNLSLYAGQSTSNRYGT